MNDNHHYPPQWDDPDRLAYTITVPIYDALPKKWKRKLDKWLTDNRIDPLDVHTIKVHYDSTATVGVDARHPEHGGPLIEKVDGRRERVTHWRVVDSTPPVVVDSVNQAINYDPSPLVGDSKTHR